MDELVSGSGGFSKRDLAYLLYKRKSQIVAVLVVSILMTTVLTYIKSRTWQAFASIYVERGEPAVATGGPPAPRVVLDRKETLNSEIDFMMSRAVLSKAADELLAPDPNRKAKPKRQPGVMLGAVKAAVDGLRATLVGIGLIDKVGPREGLINGLLSNLEAKPALMSNIITLSYEDDNGANAARVVNTVTRIYLQERLSLVKRPGLYDFYQQQIDISREQLGKLEEQERALKESSKLVVGDEEIRLRLAQLRDLDTDLKRAQATHTELAHRVETIKAQLTGMPEKVTSAVLLGQNPQVVELSAKLGVLRDERARAVQVYRNESQKIVNLDRSIASLEAHLAAIPPTVTVSETIIENNTRQNLESALRQTEVDLQAAISREQTLLAQLDGLHQDVQRIDARSAELNNIASARAAAEKSYRRYVELQEEARVAAATEVNMTNVDVIHYAAVPERPKRPRILDILIGATLGLLMGIALAFAAEFFDHTLENKEDVEKALKLPLLASLPDLDPPESPLRLLVRSLFGGKRRLRRSA
ncbi:MAG: hypothetical protein IPG43_00110 [Proteobacteria bacterium]|nr:hypothetical protein [Pseudomonadota bacterium]